MKTPSVEQALEAISEDLHKLADDLVKEDLNGVDILCLQVRMSDYVKVLEYFTPIVGRKD